MTKFCRFCGAALPNAAARFCRFCGRALKPPSSVPYLLLRMPGAAERRIPLDRPLLTLGRATDNDIVLPLKYVSNHHGRLEHSGGHWRYVDLNSTNGTYLNGKRVSSARLRQGDILRIGDIQGNSLSLTFKSPAQQHHQLPQGTIHLGQMQLGTQPTLLIGRDPQAQIPLSAPVVSWHHARIQQRTGGAFIEDLNSTNGTFVNGHRVRGRQSLQQGDRIQIGPFKLLYERASIQQYAVTDGVRLDATNIVREVGRGQRHKRILKGIDLSIQPKEFVALVGTSGAGKSTLIQALSGFTPADGQVLINGDDLYEQFDLYRTMIGYVPQDDIIHKNLSVHHALRYAAQLRLPADTSSQEIEQRIDKVLQAVGMTAQKEQPVSSLSGGQRKRVSIAAELLAEPKLFFLDEPTSGLDPGLEKKMMYTLRRLADEGRTVLLVTHATANINQCDHVCFLSQGRLVYFGPPQEAFHFFNVSSGDFADIYDRLDAEDPQEARRKARQWEQRYRHSPQYQTYVRQRQRSLSPPQPAPSPDGAERQGPRVNPLRQFSILTRRYLELVQRDPLLLTVLVAVMPIIGILLLLISESEWLVGESVSQITAQLEAELARGEESASYLIVGNTQTLLLMLSLAAVLLGLFAAAYEIVKERSIYQRERMVTLQIVPYIASKVTVLGTFTLLQCFLLLFVVGLKVSLPQDGVLFPAPVEMYVTLVLGAVAAIMLGLFLSTLAPNENTVIYLVLLVLFFQIIFAGVIFELPGVSASISKFTLSRWTMEGLGTTVNVERLNELNRTRFRPDPVTEEISMEVPKLAEDWDPVTVVTQTKEVAVACPSGEIQVPMEVPEIRENEVVTVTETVTETHTVTPDPQEISNAQTFQIDYTRTPLHLLKTWLTLGVFGVAAAVATCLALRQKDVIR
ncbi:MAG: FHA domain-containing protein [Anaerolineae bacterium]